MESQEESHPNNAKCPPSQGALQRYRDELCNMLTGGDDAARKLSLSIYQPSNGTTSRSGTPSDSDRGPVRRLSPSPQEEERIQLGQDVRNGPEKEIFSMRRTALLRSSRHGAKVVVSPITKFWLAYLQYVDSEGDIPSDYVVDLCVAAIIRYYKSQDRHVDADGLVQRRCELCSVDYIGYLAEVVMKVVEEVRKSFKDLENGIAREKSGVSTRADKRWRRNTGGTASVGSGLGGSVCSSPSPLRNEVKVEDFNEETSEDWHMNDCPELPEFPGFPEFPSLRWDENGLDAE